MGGIWYEESDLAHLYSSVGNRLSLATHRTETHLHRSTEQHDRFDNELMIATTSHGQPSNRDQTATYIVNSNVWEHLRRLSVQ